MLQRLFAAFAVLLLIAPVAARPAAQPERPEVVPADMRGMVLRDPWYDCNLPAGGDAREPDYAAQNRMGAILRETGVRWVRLEFFVNATTGGLEETFGCYDYFIQTVAPANGLKILGLLGFGLVAETPDPLDSVTGIISTTYVSDLTYGAAVNQYMFNWLERATAISSRYGALLAGYEILNEQNRLPLDRGPAVPAYLAARLHTKFYRYFKQTLRGQEGAAGAWRDDVTLLIGGLHPRGTLLPGEPGFLRDIEYLRQYFGFPKDGGAPDPKAPFQEYKAGAGQGDYPVDGLAYHPYPAEIVTLSSVEQVEAEMARIAERLGRVRATLEELGQAELPFWITEIGYDTGRRGQDEAGQAAFLRSIFTRMAGRGDVATVFWFKYEDFPGGPTAPNLWGVVHIPFVLGSSCAGGACYAPGGEPAYRRAAYLAYRELAGLPIEQLHLPMLAGKE